MGGHEGAGPGAETPTMDALPEGAAEVVLLAIPGGGVVRIIRVVIRAGKIQSAVLEAVISSNRGVEKTARVNPLTRAVDATKPAREVLAGSLRRKFPGEHLGKSLNQIKEALRTATGPAKKSLQTAKKLLEQQERLLHKLK